MKTYKQALKTPKLGWVHADFENMQALCSEQIGQTLCFNPEWIYKYGIKHNIDLEAKLFELRKDLNSANPFSEVCTNFLENVVTFNLPL